MSLGEKITKEFVEDMIQRFKDGKKLHKKYAFQIILMTKEIFMTEPTMPEVRIEEGQTLTVCGDTHGIVARVGRRSQLLISECRPVLRSPGDLQQEWLPHRKTYLPLQR